MKRWLSYIAWNGVFVACLYFGLVEGIQPAANCAQFIAWWTITMAVFVLLLQDKVATEVAKKPASPIPRLLDVSYDMAVTLTFVWFGWWATAIGYAIHVIILTGFHGIVEDKRKVATP